MYLGVCYLFSPSSPFYYYYYYYFLFIYLFILDYYIKYSKLHIANTGKRSSCVTEMNQGKALIWNSSLNDILLSNATLQDTLTSSLHAIETVGLLKKNQHCPVVIKGIVSHKDQGINVVIAAVKLDILSCESMRADVFLQHQVNIQGTVFIFILLHSFLYLQSFRHLTHKSGQSHLFAMGGSYKVQTCLIMGCVWINRDKTAFIHIILVKFSIKCLTTEKS